MTSWMIIIMVLAGDDLGTYAPSYRNFVRWLATSHYGSPLLWAARTEHLTPKCHAPSAERH